MNRNILVRYWINIGNIYSENLASIYNKRILVKENNDIKIVEDEFTGYFGTHKNREEELKAARERWQSSLESLIINPKIKATVEYGIDIMRDVDIFKSIKLKQFLFDIEEAKISVNIELEYEK